MTHCPDPTKQERRPDYAAEGGRMARLVLEYIKQQERRAVRWRIAVLGSAGLALAVALCSRNAPESPRQVEPRFGQVERSELSEDAFTEGLDASVVVIGVPLPSKPLPNWKKPPCSGKQRELNDACWAKLDQSPDDDHCGEFYEWQGGCYAPIAAPRRPPQSFERVP